MCMISGGNRMPIEPFLTVAELSATTKIAKSTLYDWVHEGFIPHIKIGGCVRFRASQVQAWLEQHAKPGRRQSVPAVEL